MNKWMDKQKIELTMFGYRVRDIPWIHGFITYLAALSLGVLEKITYDSDKSWPFVFLAPLFFSLVVMVYYFPPRKNQQKYSKWPWN